MGSPLRVFFSYATADRHLLHQLLAHVQILERLGLIDGWHDGLMQPSQETVVEIARHRDAAHLLVLLLSPSYAASDTCYAELTLARERHQRGLVQVLPVLLRPLDLPADELGPLAPVPRSGVPVTSWPQQDEAWQEVARAIRALATRHQPAGRPEEEAALGAVAMGHDLRPLQCNRTAQWGELLTLIATPRSGILLLPGESGQGHERFLLRVRGVLPQDPPRRILEVHWRRPLPRIKVDFEVALIKALGCRPTELQAALSRQLMHRNLVLLHPCVREGFDEDLLVRYYTEWLPALLGEVHHPQGLKAVQPIEWTRAPSWLRILARLAVALWPGRPGWVCRALEDQAALAMLSRIEQKARPRLPAHRLSPLMDITREHLADFCGTITLPPAQREPFIERVLRGARTSDEVLRNIADFLPEPEEA